MVLYEGFVQGSLNKFQGLYKDFSRTSQDYLQFIRTKSFGKIRIEVLKSFFKNARLTEIMEKLVLENEYEIFVPLFGAAFAAPNKGTTILY